MALNAVVCVVYIITARSFGATLAGINTLWLFVCYILANTVCQQETLIDDLLKQLKDDATLLDKYKTHIEELEKNVRKYIIRNSPRAQACAERRD